MVALPDVVVRLRPERSQRQLGHRSAAVLPSPLTPELDTARDFLADSIGDAIQLVAIRPDAPVRVEPVARWFGGDVDAAAYWAAERNGQGWNVYWSVNRVRTGLAKKATKRDIAAARFAHVDVDPPKDGADWDRTGALAALSSAQSCPSFVIDSGGGVQAFWRLEEDVENHAEIEAINRGLIAAFSGDASCSNIDRVMRLPGTVNWPDAKKRARGRVPTMARMEVEDDGVCHSPFILAAAFPATLKPVEPERATVTSTITALLTADDLGLGQFEPLRLTIEHPSNPDRSRASQACAHEMVRAGYSDAQIMGVLLNPKNPISAHCMDQDDPPRAASRCLSRARADQATREREAAEGKEIAKGLLKNDRNTFLPLQWFNDVEPKLSGLWLIKKLLPASGLALIYGHPGAGKSFLALDLAFHVALGRPWQGKRIRQGLVIYVGAEGLAGICNRMVAFRRHHALETSTPVPLALVPTAIDLQAPNADTPRLVDTIRAAADESGFEPALIVIDTLSKTFGSGKENTDDMAVYVANCARVAEAFACCVMPVHHRPKDAESTEPRGHGSLKGGMDTVILVENGRTKKATVTKQKDGPEGEVVTFVLRPIVLGKDEDGEEVTSCVVEATDAAQQVTIDDPLAKAIATLSPGTKLILNQLGEVLAEHGIEPPDVIPSAEINRLFTRVVVATGTWREKAIQAAGTDRDNDRDSGKKAFNRALKLLQSRGIVRVWGEYAWRDWGGFQAGRDVSGQAAGHSEAEAGHRDIPGHRSLDLSRCPGSSGADDDELENGE